jgi:hypothetical protein
MNYLFGREMHWTPEDVDRLSLEELNDYVRMHNEEIRRLEEIR